jgi:hypothetical protein
MKKANHPLKFHGKIPKAKGLKDKQCKEVLKPEENVEASSNASETSNIVPIIKPTEGICHHCRKSKSKKKLVHCDQQD